jgi:hypothetical protein
MATNPTTNTLTKPKTVRVLMWDVTAPWVDFLFNVSNVVLIVGALAVLLGTIGAIAMGAAREQFANERISANEAETARANNESAQALLEQERLRSQLAWRRLNPIQFQTLTDGLNELRDISISLQALTSDPESMVYGQDIERALHSAGFELNLGGGLPFGLFFGVIIKGTAENAARVHSAFIAAQIESSVQIENRPGVSILVGSKPPP